MPDVAEPSRAPDDWGALTGETVVVDTATPYVYLGRLESIGRGQLVMADVDVHYAGDSSSTRERYVMEARKVGIKFNRRRVFLRLEAVVSVSRLDDVVVY